MKKVIAFALVTILMCTMFAGCGGGGSTSSTGQPATSTPPASSTQGEAPAAETETAKEAVTIEFWNSAEGAMATSVEYLVDEFNKTVGAENNITVNSVFQGGDVVEKLKTLVQAKDYANFPDVGQIYSGGIPAVLRMEPLLPIDDIYNAGTYEIKVKKDDIIENFARSYTFEGKLIGMPLNASTLLLYYNKDAVRAAGLDPDSPPTTIAELAEWTDKLTVREGDKVTRYGLNKQVNRYELVNFLAGIGAGGVNYIGDHEGGRAATMTKLTIGEDGSFRKFLTEWQKVIATGGYKPINDNEREEFSVEMSAMNFQSSAQMKTMITLAEGKFDLGVAPLPKVTAEDAVGAAVGGGSLCMFDLGDERRKEASWEFIQYMASPEVQFYLLENNGYLPVNENTYSLSELKAFLSAQPLANVAIDQMRISHAGMQEPFDLINWELNTLVKDNMIAFAEGNITLDQCNDNVVDGFNAKLEEYNRANS